MVKCGEVINRPRYIILYDLVMFVVSTMLQYMIYSNDQVSKAVIVAFLFIKLAGGVVFIKAEDRKWMKIYFWIRIGYDVLIIVPIMLLMVGIDSMTILNALICMITIVAFEITLVFLIYKYLRLQKIDPKINELCEIEKKKNKFDEFYNLANLELFDNDSVGDSRGDPNPLQRMIIKNQKERQQDIEERFKLVKMDDYRNKKINILSNIDTLEYQFHTSNEDFQILKQYAAEHEKLNATFEVCEKSFEKENNSTHNIIRKSNIEKDPKAILADIFQRIREGPKVTRQNSNDQTKSKKTQKDSKRSKSLKKIEPSNKNKKKINETLYSVADYKPPIAKKTEKIEELKGNLEIPYSNTVINRQVIMCTSNTGNIIFVPKLPSIERSRRLS